MIGNRTFQRLERAVEVIATHRDCPDRQEAVRDCLREIVALWEGGVMGFGRWAGLVARLRFGQVGPRQNTLT